MTEQRNQKILIVDDNLATHGIYHRYLKDYPLVIVKDGLDAYSELKTNVYGLYIIDWTIKRMSAAELIDKIKETYGDVPIIALLTNCDQKSQNLIIAKGATAVFPKPFEVFEFQKKVVSYLGYPSLSRSDSEVKKDEQAVRIKRLRTEIEMKIPTFLSRFVAPPETIRFAFETIQLTGNKQVEYLTRIISQEEKLAESLIEISNFKEYKSFFKNKSLEKAIEKIGNALTIIIASNHFFKGYFVTKVKELPNYCENLFSDSFHKAILFKELYDEKHFLPVLLSRLGDIYLIDVLIMIKFFPGYVDREELVRDFIHLIGLHQKFSSMLFVKWKVDSLFLEIVNLYDETSDGRSGKGLLLSRPLAKTREEFLKNCSRCSQILNRDGLTSERLGSAYDALTRIKESLAYFKVAL